MGSKFFFFFFSYNLGRLGYSSPDSVLVFALLIFNIPEAKYRLVTVIWGKVVLGDDIRKALLTG